MRAICWRGELKFIRQQYARLDFVDIFFVNEILTISSRCVSYSEIRPMFADEFKRICQHSPSIPWFRMASLASSASKCRSRLDEHLFLWIGCELIDLVMVGFGGEASGEMQAFPLPLLLSEVWMNRLVFRCVWFVNLNSKRKKEMRNFLMSEGFIQHLFELQKGKQMLEVKTLSHLDSAKWKYLPFLDSFVFQNRWNMLRFFRFDSISHQYQHSNNSHQVEGMRVRSSPHR